MHDLSPLVEDSLRKITKTKILSVDCTKINKRFFTVTNLAAKFEHKPISTSKKRLLTDTVKQDFTTLMAIKPLHYCTVGKIYTPIFSFFGKELLISRFQT